MSMEALGQEAYNKILAKNFKEAISLLNRSGLEDGRIYSNRCYCHLELQEWESARRDAALLKEKFPEEKNGYFLLGEVMLAENRFEEAEVEYHAAYAKEPCEAIADRLFEAQMSQILQKGHDPLIARKALITTRCVQNALTSLSLEEIQKTEVVQGPPMLFSRDEEHHLFTEISKYFQKNQQQQKPSVAAPRPTVVVINRPPEKIKDPLMDPSNPLKATSLWVGNVSQEITEADLKKLFGKWGNLFSVHKREGHAFINFKDPLSAGMAMANLQGAASGNKRLIIRFQNRVKK